MWNASSPNQVHSGVHSGHVLRYPAPFSCSFDTRLLMVLYQSQLPLQPYYEVNCEGRWLCLVPECLWICPDIQPQSSKHSPSSFQGKSQGLINGSKTGHLKKIRRRVEWKTTISKHLFPPSFLPSFLPFFLSYILSFFPFLFSPQLPCGSE